MIIFVPSNLRCMGKLELIMETKQVSIYSPKYDGESQSEFAKFLSSNCSHTHPQLKAFFDAILSAIEKIQECGARENLFRPEGGRVKALPMFYTYRRVNKSVGKIRLYCFWDFIYSGIMQFLANQQGYNLSPPWITLLFFFIWYRKRLGLFDFR